MLHAIADAGTMPLDVTRLDARLGGGLPRGQVSEIVGPASSGRTSLAAAWLAAATRRGERAALLDVFDRFDPASGEACGIDLTRLLWVRGQAISKTAGAVDPAWLPGVREAHGPGTLLERTIDRALQALDLVLQSGVCTAVVLDLADLAPAVLDRIPATTWLRVQRLVDGTGTACLIVAPAPVARSAAGVTIDLRSDLRSSGVGEPRASGVGAGFSRTLSAPRIPSSSAARWRDERLAGLDVSARLISSRRPVAGAVAIDVRMPEAV